MRNKALSFLLMINMGSMAQEKEMYINKFTGINPVSYTDVIYTGSKDTVLVSTYSGRIARVINGENRERLVAQLDDEIYALAYNKGKKEIIAATLGNGLIIINERNGQIIKKIPLPSSWTNAMVFSEDLKYIELNDQNGKRYIFNTWSNYTNTDTGSLVPSGRIVKIDRNYVATIVTSKKITQWNLSEKQVVKEWDIALVKFADSDTLGNFLSVDFNECAKYNAETDVVEFKVKHPDWPLPDPENNTKVYEIPYQMQLNAAKFARNFIYTAGIDRSVRIWDKNTGKLITSLTGHKGSISKMKVSGDETQVVSVDLKGVIKFWKVN